MNGQPKLVASALGLILAGCGSRFALTIEGATLDYRALYKASGCGHE